MIDTAHKALNFVAGVSRTEFDENETLRLALTHLIQIIGESARRVSRDFRATYPEVPWKGIVGMRSKVVHDYLNVDDDVVWSTVTDDLPALVIELEKILKSIGRPTAVPLCHMGITCLEQKAVPFLKTAI